MTPERLDVNGSRAGYELLGKFAKQKCVNNACGKNRENICFVL